MAPRVVKHSFDDSGDVPKCNLGTRDWERGIRRELEPKEKARRGEAGGLSI
jgi:hypothetical protein